MVNNIICSSLQTSQNYEHLNSGQYLFKINNQLKISSMLLNAVAYSMAATASTYKPLISPNWLTDEHVLRLVRHAVIALTGRYLHTAHAM